MILISEELGRLQGDPSRVEAGALIDSRDGSCVIGEDDIGTLWVLSARLLVCQSRKKKQKKLTLYSAAPCLTT